MEKVRVLYRDDGGVSVVHPAPKSKREDETEEQWLNRVFTKATPDGLTFKDIDMKTEPLPDRRFREAWSNGTNGNTIEVDLDKAKAQVLVELRRERDKGLVITDGLMAKENEIGTQEGIDALKVYRQKLRDLPTTVGIDKIATVQELQDKFTSSDIGIDEYTVKVL